MKYRQWKKNYKTKHGVNPPLELDKKKQAKAARKALRQIKNIDTEKVADNVRISVISLISRAFEVCGNFFRDLGNSLESYGNNMIKTGQNIDRSREEDVIGRI